MCKTKWKSLRESYQKAMHARKTKSGQSEKKIKPWRLEAQMQFVKSHLFSQSDEEISNITALPESSTLVVSTENDSSHITDRALVSEYNEGELEDDGREPLFTTIGENCIKEPGENGPPSSSVNRKKTFSTENSTPSGTAEEILQHYMNMSALTNPQASGDQLTKYFQSIEETVRTLPPFIQIRLKSQISQFVHDAELEAISTPITNQAIIYTPQFPSVQQKPQLIQQSFPISTSVSVHTTPTFPSIQQQLQPVQKTFPISSENLYSSTREYQPPQNQLNTQNTQTQ